MAFDTPTLEDKRALLASAVAALREELASIQAATMDAIAGATHPDNRAEGTKDMRSTEASYVAAGTGARVLALDHAVVLCAAVPARVFGESEPARSGALVLVGDVDEQDPPAWYLLLPEGGGLELRLARSQERVRVLTPRSPFGMALSGKAQGDSVEVELRGVKRSYELLRVV